MLEISILSSCVSMVYPKTPLITEWLTLVLMLNDYYYGTPLRNSRRVLKWPQVREAARSEASNYSRIHIYLRSAWQGMSEINHFLNGWKDVTKGLLPLTSVIVARCSLKMHDFQIWVVSLRSNGTSPKFRSLNLSWSKTMHICTVSDAANYVPTFDGPACCRKGWSPWIPSTCLSNPEQFIMPVKSSDRLPQRIATCSCW